LKIDLGDGAIAHAEVEHERRVGGLGGGNDGDGEEPTGSIQTLLDTVAAIAKATAKSNAALGDAAPAAMELGFLAKYGADGELVITRVGSESHFSVKVRFGDDD
jgi:hypothetical protein